MAYCQKGHYFDESRHQGCPDCQAAASVVPATAYQEPSVPAGGLGTFGGARRLFNAAPVAKSPRVPPPPHGKTVLEQDEAASERLMGFLVVIRSPDDRSWRYVRLRKGVNRLGRFGSRAEVEIRDGQVSNEHALVICTDKATRVIDLDSANGLAVNGEAVEIATLRSADTLALGKTELTFVDFPWVADD